MLHALLNVEKVRAVLKTFQEDWDTNEGTDEVFHNFTIVEFFLDMFPQPQLEVHALLSHPHEETDSLEEIYLVRLQVEDIEWASIEPCVEDSREAGGQFIVYTNETEEYYYENEEMFAWVPKEYVLFPDGNMNRHLKNSLDREM